MNQLARLLALTSMIIMVACNSNNDSNIPDNNPMNSLDGKDTQTESNSTDAGQIDSSSEESGQESADPLDIPTDYSAIFIDCLKYEDFGAVGDGKTNDLPAIVATHKSANEQNKCVQAQPGATYYISELVESAILKTPTDWREANFVIDDSKITIDYRLNNIFEVYPSTGGYSIIDIYNGLSAPENLSTIKRHQTHLDISLPGPAVVIIFDVNVLRYIRQGGNANDGTFQMDYILVDKDGNVSPDTPIVWDYNNVTHLQVFPVDEEVLPIVGGTFTTIANQAESAYNYYNRGISVRRSNVVIDGISHYVTGELNHGAPYNGFITMNTAANITVKNAIITGHKAYMANSGMVLMGSYDIQPTGVSNLTLHNVTQSNDILDSGIFGIMGSNFCKNIVVNKCKMSRFDAHQGVTGVTIKNSELGYQGITIIGEGLLSIKNTAVYGTSFITLRDDYGSSWHGDIVIDNCSWNPYGKGYTALPFIYGSYSGKHNFGYECYMPTTITINGLSVTDLFPVYLLGNITDENTGPDFSYTYPYHITETINIKGYESTSNRPWTLSTNTYMFNNIVINEE